MFVLQSIKQSLQPRSPKLTFRTGLLLFSIDFPRLFLLAFQTFQCLCGFRTSVIVWFRLIGFLFKFKKIFPFSTSWNWVSVLAINALYPFVTKFTKIQRLQKANVLVQLKTMENRVDTNTHSIEVRIGIWIFVKI